MKKFLAILLVLMMVLVNVASVLAEDPSGDPPSSDDTPATTTPKIKPGQSAEGAQTIAITKSIVVNDDETDDTGARAPAQTITFTVGTGVASEGGKNPPTITIASAVFAEDDTEETINIQVAEPGFIATGVYEYAITETVTTAGMTAIEENNLTLKITVVQGDEGLIMGGIALRQDDQKTDTIVNNYEAGALEVGKTVTGNMGETDKEFEMTITLTNGSGKTIGSTISYTDRTGAEKTIPASAWVSNAASVTITLKHGESVTFTNIPVGVTWEVAEADYTTDDKGAYDEADYSTQSADIAKGEVGKCTVTNNKDTEIDTGVALETLPYVMILAVSMIGVVVLALRKREEY